MPVARSVEVCNMALSHLGLARINAPDEATPAARALDLHYRTVLEALLSRRDWSFAFRTAAALAQLPNEGGGVYRYKYAAPADMLMPYAVSAVAAGSAAYLPSCREPYRWHGDVLYAGVSPAWLEYHASDSPPDVWHPLFKIAFSRALSAAVAMPLTRDTVLADREIKLAELTYHAAAEADANSAPMSYLPEGGAIEYARHVGL